MKISKPQAKAHNEAKALCALDRPLTFGEKLFVLENFHEGAEHMNGTAGAFFTPLGLARDFALEVYGDKRTIDLCAGIGMLAFVAIHNAGVQDVVCVELNPAYVAIGKKIVPEANWICGSILDWELMSGLGYFGQAISNPPFGRIKTDAENNKRFPYKGGEFEFLAISVASLISDCGAFILPQTSTPFKYSGTQSMNELHSEKYEKFKSQTGIEFESNMGIDTAFYKDQWKGVSPMCEIVLCGFEAKKDRVLSGEKAVQGSLF